MKAFSLILIVLFTFNLNYLFATNTAPVAVNDTITVNSGGTYVFNPTLNDYDPDGDPFLIYSANFKNGSGSITVSYSTITIHMNYASGVDTIQYMLRDNHNAVSNIGLIFVNINPKHTTDTLNINSASAPFLPFGNAFWDFNSSSHFEVPAGSGKTTIFTSVPWVGGIDQANNLHLAAESFRTLGTDYFYGPVCDTNMLTQYSDSLWNRVWKISKAEIDFHKNNYWKSSYTVPEAIANWPAFGDTLLKQHYTMAPFIDKNNDGKYVPSDGDYPKIRGDQTVFLIFNDNKKAHTESNGQSMGLEFHEWAYAYNCASDTALDYTIFIHYDIYNRSNNNYHDVYLGMMTDFDIGYAYDDLIGCDSARNLFYAYNGKAVDGLGKPNHYGANPPAQGVLMLSDTLSSFMYFNNVGIGGPALSPDNDTGYYNFMKAIWGDGTHLTYGGSGYSGSVATNYIFSGNPNDTNSWCDYRDSTSSVPYDRRGIGSIGPFSLNSGAVKSIDFAYVFARNTTKNNIENVNTLLAAVDKIKLYYDHDSIPCGGSFSAISNTKPFSNELKIYPVPANEMITIDYLPSANSCTYEIYNITGQRIQSGIFTKSKTRQLIVSNYAKGVYIVVVHDYQKLISKKFIVE